ncbi:MAG TPA: S-layer homology domain-containing protein [Candidatus Peribacteraceae bacterium]|nr:S-layer homology domain-containing protein [Candidatus Peribacteraceae bacterium]
MKRFTTSLGILAVLFPLTTQALMVPGAVRQTPGNYQSVGDNSVLPRSSSSSAVTMNVERNATLGVRFSYPSNWTITPADGGVTIAPIPDDYVLSTQRDSRIVFTITPIAGGKTYSQHELNLYFMNRATIASDSTALIDWYIPSFHLSSSGTTTLLGQQAIEYDYTGEVQSVKMHIVHLLASVNGKLISLRYESPLDTFDEDRPVFDALIPTIVWLSDDTSTSSASSVTQAQSSSASAVAASFSDVDVSTPMGQAIAALAARGVIGGYSDGTFRPNATVNRAELLKILIAGLHKGEMKNEDGCFPDFAHQWFSQYVCAAKRLKWVGGYPDGTFRPGNTVTQAEAIKMIVSSLPASAASSLGALPAGIDASAWYALYVQKAVALGIFTHTSFTAGADLTRGQAALWIENAVEATGE